MFSVCGDVGWSTPTFSGMHWGQETELLLSRGVPRLVGGGLCVEQYSDSPGCPVVCSGEWLAFRTRALWGGWCCRRGRERSI